MSFRASQKCEQTFFQTWKRCKQMMYKIKLQECMISTNKYYTGQLFRLNLQRLIISAFHKLWFHTGTVIKLWYQMQVQNFNLELFVRNRASSDGKLAYILSAFPFEIKQQYINIYTNLHIPNNLQFYFPNNFTVFSNNFTKKKFFQRLLKFSQSWWAWWQEHRHSNISQVYSKICDW